MKRWSAAQRKKFMRTVKRRGKGRKVKASTEKDVMIYLQHAERRIMQSIRDGAKRIGPSDLHSLLALATLRGEL